MQSQITSMKSEMDTQAKKIVKLEVELHNIHIKELQKKQQEELLKQQKLQLLNLQHQQYIKRE